jgi:flagellar protein FlbT
VPLKITLRPNEKVLIGRVVLTNGPREAEFEINGDRIPILRASQILRPEQADTPCKQFYVVIQSLYIGDGDAGELFDLFVKLAGDIEEAAPSLATLVAEISALVMEGDHYPALRRCQRLIEREAELLDVAVAT